MAVTLFFTHSESLENSRYLEYILYKGRGQLALVEQLLDSPKVVDSLSVAEKVEVAIGVRPFIVFDIRHVTDSIGVVLHTEFNIDIIETLTVDESFTGNTEDTLEVHASDSLMQDVGEFLYTFILPNTAVVDVVEVLDNLSIAIVGPEDTEITERLYHLLPSVYKSDDVDGIIRKVLNVLDRGIQDIYDDIESFPDIVNPDKCPPQYLDHMLRELGNPFPQAYIFPVSTKRKMVKSLVQIYREKGTVRGVVNAARVVLGMEVELRSYNVDSWHIGIEHLGYDTYFAPSTRGLGKYRRFIYSFEVSVIIPKSPSPDQVRSLYDLVYYMKPHHTHFTVNIGNPVYDHWELGISRLGVDTLLHGGRVSIDNIPVLDFVNVFVGGWNVHVIENSSLLDRSSVFVDGCNITVITTLPIGDSIIVDDIPGIASYDVISLIERSTVIVDTVDCNEFDDLPVEDFINFEFVVDLEVVQLDVLLVLDSASTGRNDINTYVSDNVVVLESIGANVS